ncbi:MAG: asparagine synthase B, partial [Bacteroidales bacterium]
MCGILAVIGKKDPEVVKQLSKRMKHRGPDESGFLQLPNGYILSHERLSIMDLHTGRQPIRGTYDAYVIHNGEIYNYMHLRRTKLADHTFRTTCDSEVIVHLYEKYGYDFCNELDGDWAFVVVDGDKFMAARDPIGVKPFYYGKDAEGNIYFSSELKAIEDQCTWFDAFPPGHYYTGETGLVKYYNPKYHDYTQCTDPANLT